MSLLFFIVNDYIKASSLHLGMRSSSLTNVPWLLKRNNLGHYSWKKCNKMFCHINRKVPTCPLKIHTFMRMVISHFLLYPSLEKHQSKQHILRFPFPLHKSWTSWRWLLSKGVDRSLKFSKKFNSRSIFHRAVSVTDRQLLRLLSETIYTTVFLILFHVMSCVYTVSLKRKKLYLVFEKQV